MEEIREMIQILKFIILLFTVITIFIIGVCLEMKRPVELIPCGGEYFTKIKKGPPWLAIFTLIDFVVAIIIFILFMLMR